MAKTATASRLIVKNIPKHVDEKRLRQHFSVKAELTDAKIVRTKDGKSRQFAFVGFATDEDAREAVKYYNSTFLDTSRIQVEPAQPRGDPSIGRPWSKHSEGSSRMQQRQQLQQSSKAKSKAGRGAAGSEGSRDGRDIGGADDVKNSSKASASTSTSASDSGRAPGRTDRTDPAAREVGREEFFAAMKARSQARFWDNDDALLNTSRAGALDEGNVPDGADESGDEDESEEKELREEERISAAPLSDMNWLRSRVMHDDDEKADTGAGAGAGADAESDDEEEEEEEESENEPAADGGDSQSSLRVKDGKDATHKKSRDAGAGAGAGADADADADADGDGNADAGSGAGDASNGGSDDDEDDSKPSGGRLFVRNLPYVCTEEDLQELFEQFGLLSEVHLPLDDFNKVKGFAFVQYALPEDATEAMRHLDKHAFRGRLLHVIPARKQLGSAVPGNSSSEAGSASASGKTFKQQKENARREKAGDSKGWNASFMRADTVVDALADRLGVSKGDILDREGNDMAVRLALGESQLVKENKEYFEQEGINLNSLESSKAKGGGKVAEERSKTVLLVKNLPYTTDVTELAKRFGAFGDVGRVLLPPSKAVALVEFLAPADARRAFKRLAYTKFQHVPLYLEWAPLKAFRDSFRPSSKPATLSALAAGEGRTATADEAKVDGDEVEAGQASQEPCTIFVKNLSFSTNEEGLKACFVRAGLAVRSVSIPRKKGKGKSEGMLSSGIGFVECVDPGMADKALKALQGTILDGHALEVKRSTKRLVKGAAKASQQAAGEKRSKLIIRNIPFQATAKELRELFSSFGQLKRLRLPKKFDGGHRGFAFVDFLTSQEAQNAKASLESTHFYGRHLVGEWAEDDEAVETLRAKAAKDMQGVAESAKRAKRKRAGDSNHFDDDQS